MPKVQEITQPDGKTVRRKPVVGDLVDLLQRQNVRVQASHGCREPVDVHAPVAGRPAVQHVEGATSLCPRVRT